MKKWIELGALVACGSGVFAAPSLAVDAKVYPGTMCMTEYEPNQYLQRTQNYAYTTEDGTRMSCPIIRDNTINTTGISDVEVIMDEQSTTERGFCTVYATGDFGGVHDYYTVYVGTNNAVTGVVQMDFGSMLDTSVAGGAYAMTCYVPHTAGRVASRLVLYRVAEY